MRNDAAILNVIAPKGVTHVHGVTFDGRHIWAAVGDRMIAVDPNSGAIDRYVSVPATAGTAFDGRYLYQLAGGRIHVIDGETGKWLRDFAAPSGEDCSGLAWSEGSLWIGQYVGGRILEVAPDTGRILREIEMGRHVTGVTWTSDHLWHGSWDGEQGTLHQFDLDRGEARQTLLMPAGVPVTGIEAGGDGQAFCGAGAQGKIYVVQIGQT